MYLNYVQYYIRLNAILAKLQQNPHKVVQRNEISTERKESLKKELLALGIDMDYINKLEIFKE